MFLKLYSKICNKIKQTSISWYNYTPVIFFIIFYIIFVVLGVYLTIWSNPFFRNLNIVLTGSVNIFLNNHEKTKLLNVLLLPPLAFVFGYTISNYYNEKFKKFINSISTHLPSFSGVINYNYLLLCYAIVTSIVYVSLFQAGAWGMMKSWLATYDQMIGARYKIFSAITTIQFIFIYMIYPTISTVTVIETWNLKKQKMLAFILSIPCTLSLMMVFQKRPLIIYFLILMISVILLKQSLKNLIKGFLFLFLVVFSYFIMIILPTLELTKTNLKSPNLHIYLSEKKEVVEEEELEKEQDFLSKLSPGVKSSIVAINGIVNRVSLPAIFYLKAYPLIYPFEGLDIPFDRKSPSDNVKIYKLMWPSHEWGMVAAPAPFVFYSQGGLSLSIILFFILGIGIFILWKYITSDQIKDSIRSTQAALVVLLMIYITMDSVYNSIMTSYGVFWGIAALEILKLSTFKKAKI